MVIEVNLAVTLSLLGTPTLLISFLNSAIISFATLVGVLFATIGYGIKMLGSKVGNDRNSLLKLSFFLSVFSGVPSIVTVEVSIIVSLLVTSSLGKIIRT